MNKFQYEFLMTVYRALMMISKGLKKYLDNVGIEEKENGFVSAKSPGE